MPGPAQPPISIRGYTDSDGPALVDLFRRSVRELASRDYALPQLIAWAPDEIDAAAFAARRAGHPTFIAEIAGNVAGFADLEADPVSAGHIDMLYVDPRFTRRGVAASLLRHIETEARRLNLLRLHTEASIGARLVFEQNGFVTVTPQTVWLRGQSFTNYRMEKLLLRA